MGGFRQMNNCVRKIPPTSKTSGSILGCSPAIRNCNILTPTVTSAKMITLRSLQRGSRGPRTNALSTVSGPVTIDNHANRGLLSYRWHPSSRIRANESRNGGIVSDSCPTIIKRTSPASRRQLADFLPALCCTSPRIAADLKFRD